MRKQRHRARTAVLALCSAAGSLHAADELDLLSALNRTILGLRQTTLEVQVYAASRVPPAVAPGSGAEWDRQAEALRKSILSDVFLRGEAARWSEFKGRIEWFDTIEGPGYRIRKLRYEVIPGLWSPALLYEPLRLSGKVPAVLNVNGHERTGVSTPYIQERCINLAKRGLLALNVEWYGRGQMSSPGFNHYLINQLDLAGTAGISLHYLSQRRALDILLAHENTDASRVAATGLSGGSWQTIIIGSLDTRVKLANPVAGYSSFVTRAQWPSLDLGDSEQTPSDLATVADYTHLTAMLAPRPALLTYNSRDDCCFRADYAVSPLMVAARPFYRLFDKESQLRYHVNYDAGHNYGKDNREAFYRMLRDFFYGGSAEFRVEDIPSATEVREARQLEVPMPRENLDFHQIAISLSKALPVNGALPEGRDAAAAWQEKTRRRLREIVRAPAYEARAEAAGEATLYGSGVRVSYWRLRMGDTWTVPVVELEPREPKGAVLLLGDGGRTTLLAEIERLLAAGRRVVAVDPFYFGESKIAQQDYLFAILVAAVGERPLGIQASQVGAVARWLEERRAGPVEVTAFGPRTGIIATVAAALEPRAIRALKLHDSLGSLREIIERGLGANSMPEQFCFGLLKEFDVRQLAALVAPRPAVLVRPSERARKELAGLDRFYRTLGAEFDPLAARE